MGLHGQFQIAVPHEFHRGPRMRAADSQPRAEHRPQRVGINPSARRVLVNDAGP